MKQHIQPPKERHHTCVCVCYVLCVVCVLCVAGGSLGVGGGHINRLGDIIAPH